MPRFELDDVSDAVNRTPDPFDDHHYWRIAMPYGPGYGLCWTAADNRPSREWVLEQLETFARRSSYEIACGRMLGPYGLHLE